MSAELVLACRDVVGESLVWSTAESALYWVDIVGRRIHRLEPASGRHDVFPTPDLVTSIGLRRDGGFIVGLRRIVALWRPGGPFEPLAEPEPGRPGNRLNEGVVAPDGSFWVGTMADNVGPDGGPMEIAGKLGRLYRIAPDGTVARLSDDLFGITNSMVWTDDGRFVTADTLANEIYVYDCRSPARLSGRRRHAAAIDRGLPDGSSRNAAGVIFNARVAGGGAIARIGLDPDTAELVELPCRSPTSSAFGGPSLDTLFVTSSRFGMSAKELEGNEIDGGLFAIAGLGPGLPAPVFG